MCVESLIAMIWAAAAKVEADRLTALGQTLTVISTVTAEDQWLPSNSQQQYYTLNGQKVTTPRRGIYIRNGKKIVVK